MLCVNQYTKQHARNCCLRFSEHVEVAKLKR